MFRLAINKLSGWLFSRVLVSHAGGPVSNPDRDMSVLGLLDYSRIEMTPVKSLNSGEPDVIRNTRTCKVSARQQAVHLASAIRPTS